MYTTFANQLPHVTYHHNGVLGPRIQCHVLCDLSSISKWHLYVNAILFKKLYFMVLGWKSDLETPKELSLILRCHRGWR